MGGSKIILLPKTIEDEIEFSKAVDYDESNFLVLRLKDDDFNKLWDLNVFDNINKIADVNIDEFEDDSIHDSNSIREVIAYLSTTKFSIAIQPIIEELILMCKESLIRKTGIYFYF